MTCAKTFLIGCLLASTTSAQTEDSLRSRIAKTRYPPLAEWAGIQGDVRISVSAGSIELVSGHPLLAPLATGNAQTFDALNGHAKLDMTYHFVAVNAQIVPKSTTVKIGNSCARAVLRMLGFKPERVVHTYECVEGVAPANEVKIDGAVVEVWVYGKVRCAQTNRAEPSSKHSAE